MKTSRRLVSSSGQGGAVTHAVLQCCMRWLAHLPGVRSRDGTADLCPDQPPVLCLYSDVHLFKQGWHLNCCNPPDSELEALSTGRHTNNKICLAINPEEPEPMVPRPGPARQCWGRVRVKFYVSVIGVPPSCTRSVETSALIGRKYPDFSSICITPQTLRFVNKRCSQKRFWLSKIHLRQFSWICLSSLTQPQDRPWSIDAVAIR